MEPVLKPLFNTQTFLKLMVLMMLTFVTTNTVMAQQKPKAEAPKLPDSVKIAVIDMNVIRQSSKAVKDINKQLTTYANEYQKEMQKEDKALKAANDKLVKKRTILAREAFIAERKKFEQKLVAVQRLVQKRKQDLNKSRNDALLVVNEKLSKIIADYAEEKNIGLIVRRNQAILVSNQLDITDALLKKLDQALPSVKVEKPGKK